MRIEELRDELDEIAARAPSARTDGRAVVFERGRRLVRRRRIARAGTALAAVAALGAGLGIWRAQTGSGPGTVVTDIPTTVRPTAPTTIAPPATTPSTSPTPTTVHVPVVSPVTQTPGTSTAPPASTRALIAPDAGFAFFSTPVVSGNSVFVLESNHAGVAPVDARVVRIDVGSRRIVATSDQPGADVLAVAGGRVFVGVYSGSSGSSFDPSIARVVSLDPQTLAANGSVTLPAAGGEGLVGSSGAVWTLSGNDALRIDATTRAVATIPLALPASQPHRTLAVSADGTRLYVGWASAQQVEGVAEFDATNGTALHQNAQVGSGPSNIGPLLNVAGSRLWVTFPTGTMGSAVALHTSDLSTTGETVSGPNSLQIAPAGAVVWVSRGATLDCVTFNDATLASHTLGGGIESAAAPTANAVYVATGDGLAVVAPDVSCPS